MAKKNKTPPEKTGGVDTAQKIKKIVLRQHIGRMGNRFYYKELEKRVNLTRRRHPDAEISIEIIE